MFYVYADLLAGGTGIAIERGRDEMHYHPDANSSTGGTDIATSQSRHDVQQPGKALAIVLYRRQEVHNTSKAGANLCSINAFKI